ncbi:MAG: hypothetical protein M0T82_14785 [Desulfobacteraceae bacterium]|nr:hypothetical protein [Desulfobacteraceae bacterium]
MIAGILFIRASLPPFMSRFKDNHFKEKYKLILRIALTISTNMKITTNDFFENIFKKSKDCLSFSRPINRKPCWVAAWFS